MKKFISKEIFFIISIILISIFFSISYSYIQRAIDGGLVISEIVKYPNEFSAMKAYYFNSWTFIHQFSAFFLKLDFSILTTSRIILFFSTLAYFIGIYLIIKSITLSSGLAFFTALTLIIFRKNFGDLDYPSLIFSTHSYGMTSLAIATLVFGLIGKGNFFWSSFFSIFLICIHPVVGAWITFILFLSFFISKLFFHYPLKEKKIIEGTFFGIFIILISFYFFYINMIDKIPYNEETYSIYMELWETHRIYYGKAHVIHYDYLLKSIILIFTCLAGIKFFKNEFSIECRQMIIAVLLTSSISILIYIIYKLYPNIFPSFLISVMPTRFANMHSFIGWPIIISFIYIFIKNFLIKKNLKKIYAQTAIFLILFYYSASHYKNILIRVESFFYNIKIDNSYQTSNNFWNKVKNIYTEGFVLTSSNAAYPALQKSYKPVLFFPDQIDFIPYHPYAVENIKNIIEKIYDLPFNVPPESSQIPDHVIRLSFENKNLETWKKLSEEFNLSGLIVPSDWKINLKLEFSDNNFSYYEF